MVPMVTYVIEDYAILRTGAIAHSTSYGVSLIDNKRLAFIDPV